MKDNESILGCFTSGATLYHNSDQNATDLAKTLEKEFKEYIWGTEGICDILKQLNYKSYGKDLELILYQFYLNPIPYELEHFKELGSYMRKKNNRNFNNCRQ